jgi:hypothetical protein
MFIKVIKVLRMLLIWEGMMVARSSARKNSPGQRLPKLLKVICHHARQLISLNLNQKESTLSQHGGLVIAACP